ncbi:hypothetical protein IJJ08_01800 [bacterium]|nr:hypothetical protein [bacterium]
MSRVFGRIFLLAIFFTLTGSLARAASGNQTMKLKDVVSGNVVRVGGVKFVKVAADKYLALDLCPDDSTYSSFYKGCVVKTTTFDYTGNYQTFTAPATGTYVVELWGASGGPAYVVTAPLAVQNEGGYAAGNIQVPQNTSLFIYVGEEGKTGVLYSDTQNAYNGGGTGGSGLKSQSSTNDAGGGGGAVINYVNEALKYNDSAGISGGLQGYGNKQAWHYMTYDSMSSSDATQVSGYDFGIGQNGSGGPSEGIPGAGGGWYGGYINTKPGCATCGAGSGGGSSYISGHTGCVAVTSLTDTTPKAGCDTGTTDRNCSLSPTGYSFTNTTMIDGASYTWTNTKGELTPMPDPTSVGNYYVSGVGHTGNGVARITQLAVYLGI